MKVKRATQTSLLVILPLAAVYDVAALYFGGVEATISQVLGLDWSFEAPLIPFGVGILCGHLFWPQYAKGQDE